MKTILKLIKFELKQRMFTWLSGIFFIMLVFQAIWYTKGSFDYYVNDGVLMNAPVIIYRNYSGLGMIMSIIVIIVTTGVIFKDIQYKTAQWFYTFPVKEKQFYLGRFFSAFVYLFILSLGLTLGNLLTPYSGIGTANRFGETPILQMLHSTVLFLIPNLLLFVSVIFTSVVYFKKTSAGYLSAFLLLVIFLVMQVAYEGSDNTSVLYSYFDPMGYVAVQYYYELIPTEQKNTGFIQLTRYLLTNRILWLCITSVIFYLGYRKFSFKHFLANPTKEKVVKDSSKTPIENTTQKLISPKLSFKTTDFIKKLYTLSKLEFLKIVRPTSFKIIIGILMFMVFLQNLLFNANFYIGYEVPLTSNMTYFRLVWGVFIVMLLMIWSGELFFKERIVKIWQITDALPIPVWVTQLSKFIASCGLAFVLCVSFMIIGVFTQLVFGRPDLIDLKQYIIDVFGYRWGFINFVFEIALVFFIAGLTGKRFLTHILSVGYFLFLVISFDMGILEQVRYGFALTPGVDDYSEMSGYGILGLSANWFGLLWAVLSIVFILLGILFWQRGAPKKWYKKIAEHQLSVPSKVFTVFLLGVFFALQFFIHKNVYDNGNFKLSSVRDFEAADYEKTYKYLEEKEHPKYQTIDLNLDYFPKQKKVAYNAVIGLNKQPKDTLFLSFKDAIKIDKILLNKQPLTLVHSDATHNVLGYLVPVSSVNDSDFTLYLNAHKQYNGFSQSELQSDITSNGSYASIKEFLPTIGYDSDKELDENRKRSDNGLEKLKSRMASVNDTKALTQHATTEDAEKVTANITINTPKEQMAVAPGIFVSQTQKDGRNHATYRIEESNLFNWHVGSASYKKFADGVIANTNYQIYAKPSHSYNIAIYKDALEKSLSYFKAALPRFDLEQIRLYEKHHWSDTDIDAFANAIVISEKHGWVADTSEIGEKAYIYQTVAAQIATLWVDRNYNIANVQGANMLRVAFPEALGLMFIEKELGLEALEHIKKKKYDRYAKKRNNEPNQEPPLMFDDGADYLAVNKGAIQIYSIFKITNPKLFISAMDNNSTHNQHIVFKDIYNALVNMVSANEQQLLNSLMD